MIKIIKKFIFIFVIIDIFINIYSLDSHKFAFMNINLGARASGMAGAFTAIADDATSIYYNPAGLANLKMIEINASHNIWFMDSSLSYGYLNIPVGFGNIGVLFLYTNYGEFEERDEYGQPLNVKIEPHSLSGSISYGLPINSIFSAGLGFKFSNFVIGDYSIDTLNFDLGLKADINNFILFGLALQNMDFEFSNNFNINGGIAVNILNIQNNKITVDFDIKYSGIYGPKYTIGTEIQLFKFISIRTGYVFDNENEILGGMSGLSLGAGIIIEKLSIDYAFNSHGELGMTHLFGLKFIYEGPIERERSTYRKLTEFLAYQNYKDGEEAFNSGNYKKALIYWEEVKSMMPDYEGIDEAITNVQNIIKMGGSLANIDKLFNQGMSYYEKFDFDNAVKKWTEVKKIMPNYKDIDVWLADVKDLQKGGKMSKEAEKYFRQGLKHYNNCDYIKAITAWEIGLSKDPKNKKINQYIERAKLKQQEIANGILKAKADIANDATIIDGVKRLREISNVCPAYNDAIEILATIKSLINIKTKEYYLKGIEKYTEGNMEAAIVYWNNIEKLDPKSEYIIKVRRYITDARNKQKAVLGIEKQNKK
ncbi:MAG: PorV/PorQ family protein [Candidatus Goldbacteria bacterium]|nr:PorV/PorQ family protein [Candidatus Goldiibacteriota bacterium]